MSDLAKLHVMYDTVAKAYVEAAKKPRIIRQNLRYWKQQMDLLDKKLAEQGET